ncbi:MAG: copper chaperone PCu(A)C [Paracoccaceae bacterium]|nr:copper chaperone PCu(A)C [Paracoccaceae bacterium]
MRQIFQSAAVVLLSSFPLFAKDGITVEAPWARATILMSRPGVVYLTIRSSIDDQLIGIETPVAETVMIHTVETSEDISHMISLSTLPLPAGQTVLLAPGKIHLMLMGLHKKLVKGETFPITLKFKHAEAISLNVPILGIAAKNPTDTGQ